MTAKELLGWLKVLSLAALAAAPDSDQAKLILRLIMRLIDSLSKLLDGSVSEADLRLPSYEETLAEVRGAA